MKSLAERLADGSFEPRRHRGLLDGPLLPDVGLRELQVRYQRAAGDETARRRLAHELREASFDAGEAPLLERVRLMSFEAFVAEFLPFALAPFQVEFDREFRRLREDGSRLWKVGLLGLGRGNGKTALASAVTLYEVLRLEERSDVLFAASSRQQARIGAAFVRDWVRLNPRLRQVVELTKDELTVLETGSVMRVLPATGDVVFGETPRACVADELWVWKRDASRSLWEALTSGLGKKPDAWLLGISTAPAGSESLLAELLEVEFGKPMLERPRPGLTVVRDEEAATLTWWYGADAGADPADLEVVAACNPAPWLAPAAVARQRLVPGMTEGAYRRLHLNTPEVEDEEDALVTREQLEACRADLEGPPIGAAVWIGAERDYGGRVAALATLWRLPDGRLAGRVRVWATQTAEALAHERAPSWRRLVDMGRVFAEVERLDAEHAVQAIGRDGGEVRLDHPAAAEVRSGSSAQKDGSRRLHQMILDREVALAVDDVLADHLTAARGEVDTHGRLNVYRRQQERSIAAWYALTAAVVTLDVRPASVYSARGVIGIDAGRPTSGSVRVVDGELVPD